MSAMVSPPLAQTFTRSTHIHLTLRLYVSILILYRLIVNS